MKKVLLSVSMLLAMVIATSSSYAQKAPDAGTVPNADGLVDLFNTASSLMKSASQGGGIAQTLATDSKMNKNTRNRNAANLHAKMSEINESVKSISNNKIVLKNGTLTEIKFDLDASYERTAAVWSGSGKYNDQQRTSLVRKGMQDLKVLAQEIRQEVQDMKNAD